ncbi:hypothetical protein K1X76_06675 [bacterium]|nr:hypothetical protein [bacterium]
MKSDNINTFTINNTTYHHIDNNNGQFSNGDAEFNQDRNGDYKISGKLFIDDGDGVFNPKADKKMSRSEVDQFVKDIFATIPNKQYSSLWFGYIADYLDDRSQVLALAKEILAQGNNPNPVDQEQLANLLDTIHFHDDLGFGLGYAGISSRKDNAYYIDNDPELKQVASVIYLSYARHQINLAAEHLESDGFSVAVDNLIKKAEEYAIKAGQPDLVKAEVIHHEALKAAYTKAYQQLVSQGFDLLKSDHDQRAAYNYRQSKKLETPRELERAEVQDVINDYLGAVKRYAELAGLPEGDLTHVLAQAQAHVVAYKEAVVPKEALY